ncbi:MAG TPA: hypothetical protein VIK86_03515 [Candidatus Paceibacterota bacterium]
MNVALQQQETQATSAGNAMRRYGTYGTSIEAKMNDVKNAAQQMWMKLIDSNAMKGLLDLASGFLKLSGSATGVRLIISALSGVISGLLTTAILSVAMALPKMIIGIIEATSALSTMNIVMGGLPIVIGLIVTGLSIATNGFGMLNDKTGTYQKTVDDLIAKEKALTDEYKQNADAIDKQKTSSMGETEVSKSLIENIFKLSTEMDKSNTKRTQMLTLVGELNKLMPNLNLQYDTETGKLSKNREEIYKNITALEQYYITKASGDKAATAGGTILDQSQIIDDTTSKITETQKQLDAQKAKMASYVKSNPAGASGDAFLDMNNEASKIDRNLQKLINSRKLATETMGKAKADIGDFQKRLLSDPTSVIDPNAKTGDYDSGATTDFIPDGGTTSSNPALDALLAQIEHLKKIGQLTTQQELDRIRNGKANFISEKEQWDYEERIYSLRKQIDTDTRTAADQAESHLVAMQEQTAESIQQQIEYYTKELSGNLLLAERQSIEEKIYTLKKQQTDEIQAQYNQSKSLLALEQDLVNAQSTKSGLSYEHGKWVQVADQKKIQSAQTGIGDWILNNPTYDLNNMPSMNTLSPAMTNNQSTVTNNKGQTFVINIGKMISDNPTGWMQQLQQIAQTSGS